MDKLYEKIVFANNTTPSLNASNLNAISEAIDQIDDRVIAGYANAQIAGTEAAKCSQYATNASNSATAASGSATRAETAATNAETATAQVSADLQTVIDALDELLG